MFCTRARQCFPYFSSAAQRLRVRRSALSVVHPALRPTLTRSFARRAAPAREVLDDEKEELAERAEADEDGDGAVVSRSGLSKAERLRLREKEKRRAKLAQRELSDTKKRRKAQDRSTARRPAARPLPAIALQGGEETAMVDIDIDVDAVRDVTSEVQARDEGADEYEEDDADGEVVGGAGGASDPRPRNGAIKGDVIVLIDPQGKRIGRVSLSAAVSKARAAGLDLLQLSPPQVVPPVCRVVHYAEFYAAEQAKRAKALGLDEGAQGLRTKTLRLRKAIDPHDLAIKVNTARQWLGKGWTVRVVYFEKVVVDDERRALMLRVQALLQGAAAAQNIEATSGYVVFEPLRGRKAIKSGASGATADSKEAEKAVQGNANGAAAQGRSRSDVAKAAPVVSTPLPAVPVPATSAAPAAPRPQQRRQRQSS